MNKMLLVAVDSMLVGVLITGCGNAGMFIATSTPVIPTSTHLASTATQALTVTVMPSATTAELLPISPEAAAYLKEALDIMQNNSLHKYDTDWDEIRTSAFEVAQHAQTPADTYGAISYPLVRLGDHHSQFLPPADFIQRQESTVSESPSPRGKLLLGKLGFVALEGFIGPQGAEYATLVQQLIRNLDTQGACGWIVDLREHVGGNMWPGLAGLGPILGNGKAGAFVDPDGNKVDWGYRDGQAFLGDYVQVQVDGPVSQLKLVSSPVAVLTGVNTASAGEALVVAFRGRPTTRSFGLYTTGLSTGNQGFPLSDGAWIVLTTSVYADRTGQTYGDRIYPDEVVDDVRKFTFIVDEAIPQPAIDWLMSQPACMSQN